MKLGQHDCDGGCDTKDKNTIRLGKLWGGCRTLGEGTGHDGWDVFDLGGGSTLCERDDDGDADLRLVAGMHAEPSPEAYVRALTIATAYSVRHAGELELVLRDERGYPDCVGEHTERVARIADVLWRLCTLIGARCT